jgi:hypothetical protein
MNSELGISVLVRESSNLAVSQPVSPKEVCGQIDQCKLEAVIRQSAFGVCLRNEEAPL